MMAIGNSIKSIFVASRKHGHDQGPRIIPQSFFDRFGPDIAIVKKDMLDRYHVTTWSDLGREKRRRQAQRLNSKRFSGCETNVRAVYVWVFHCPGLGGVAYYGWWTYLVWRGGDSGKYFGKNIAAIGKLMELFPMEEPGLFGHSLAYEEWQIRFAKTFACRNADGTLRKHAGRIQGKALLWAEFHGAAFWRIIGRAYLPRQSPAAEGLRVETADERG
jgi:hypothetical protein